MVAATAPVRTPKGERTAERILDTAEALFAERGYAGTTLRDVASAVGLRIPSLYNHFASKDALYSAVLERGIAPVIEALAAPDVGRADAAQRILGLLNCRPNLPRLVQQEVLRGGEHLSPVLAEWFTPALAQAEETLRARPGARRWSDEQIPLLVLALYQVVVGYFAIAPLVKALNGEDLLASDALARQTRFFADLVAVLLPEE